MIVRRRERVFDFKKRATREPLARALKKMVRRKRGSVEPRRNRHYRTSDHENPEASPATMRTETRAEKIRISKHWTDGTVPFPLYSAATHLRIARFSRRSIPFLSLAIVIALSTRYRSQSVSRRIIARNCASSFLFLCSFFFFFIRYLLAFKLFTKCDENVRIFVKLPFSTGTSNDKKFNPLSSTNFLCIVCQQFICEASIRIKRYVVLEIIVQMVFNTKFCLLSFQHVTL